MSLVAWRAAQGTMRAIAPSMPPHACPLPGRRRPTPRFFAAGVVIDFAFTAVNGLEMALLAPGRATGGQRRIFVLFIFVVAVVVAAADASGCALLSSQVLPLPPMPC